LEKGLLQQYGQYRRFELIVSGLKGDALSSLVSIDDFPKKSLFILP
jgi:hypothetical protein